MRVGHDFQATVPDFTPGEFILGTRLCNTGYNKVGQLFCILHLAIFQNEMI